MEIVKNNSAIKDLSMKKFGKLTAIKYIGKDKVGHAKWMCKCDCGNIKNILGTHLISGNIISCGCGRKERFLKFEKEFSKENSYKIKRIYHIFNGMRQRCNNQKNKGYESYGGRGIIICDEWLNDFNIFASWAMNNGYEDDLTLDRIDVNGNYTPSNCRWVNMKTQENNRRDNIRICYNGESKTLKEWATSQNIPYSTIYTRYKNGLDIEKIISKKDLRRIYE